MMISTGLALTVVAARFWHDRVGGQIRACELLKKRMPFRQWDMNLKIHFLRNRRARLFTYMVFVSVVSVVLWTKGL